MLLLTLAFAAAPLAKPMTESFDGMQADAAPSGWTCGLTGAGTARWLVTADASAPTKPNVLKQIGEGDFPWCAAKDARLGNGFAEVKLKPISGKEDQAGGVIWRFKDGDNYYIARANAVEDNVAVFIMQKGRRRLLKSVSLHVESGAWHTLRVEFNGPRYVVSFDGKRAVEGEDGTLADPGSVGLWTKADSVIAFDSFASGTL
jgi:hypothetical protein